jgi:IMP dehydrogenase
MFYTEDLALTYDDVLLVPNYSEVLPTEVQLKTRFSKNITMNIPIASSAMDTVTESRTAIVMAQEGGIGVIHKNLTPEEQAFEVEKVKKYESGMILDPFTVHPEQSVADLFELMKKYKISGFPVIDQHNKLIGIITNRDLRFVSDIKKKVAEVMTSQNLVTAPEGTSFERAREILQQHRVEKLPVVDAQGKLRGLITIKDIEKTIAYPHANKDKYGRLRVAAACGVSDKEMKRVMNEMNNKQLKGIHDIDDDDEEFYVKKFEELHARYPLLEYLQYNVPSLELASYINLIDKSL